MEDVYYATPRTCACRSIARSNVLGLPKIENVDFVGIETSPFDVRFSVNHEEPMQGEFVWDRKRSKQRTFIRKNLSIDMTFSTGAAFDKDDEIQLVTKSYKVVDPSEISCEEELFNIAYKINDIMRILNKLIIQEGRPMYFKFSRFFSSFFSPGRRPNWGLWNERAHDSRWVPTHSGRIRSSRATTL